MTYVRYDVRDRVAVTTLDNPGQRNPMNETMVAELIDALQKAQSDDDVSVVLLRAEGDSFCAGGDLKAFREYRNRPATELYREGRGTAELFKVLGSMVKPVVGAINGAALGGGCGLACACTIAIASDRAKFGLTELRLGLFPLVIMPAVRSAMGDRRALEFALMAEIIDARAAQEAGIVTRVVPHDRLDEEARKTAEHIAGFSPIAIRLGLEAFRNSTGAGLGQAIEYINALRAVCFQTEDLREGATAFLEKRRPQWKGQ